MWSKTTCDDSDSIRLGALLARLIWALPTAARARSYWPTPTAKANHWSPSMRKWPAYDRLQSMIPKPSVSLFEWLMGSPRSWSGSGSSEREWSLWWQRAHSSLWRDD